MIYKYFINFKLNNTSRSRYIKARSYKAAIIKLINAYKVDDITYISFEGDPLPTTQFTASQLLKQKNIAKENKRKGAIKYYNMSGKSVLDKQ